MNVLYAIKEKCEKMRMEEEVRMKDPVYRAEQERIEKARIKAEDERMLECKKREIEKTYEDFPERFKNVIFNKTIDDKRISEVAKKYVNDKAWTAKKWALIVGSESGAGKSFDASFIIHNAIEAGVTFYKWTMPERMITEIINDKDNIRLKEYKDCSILVIDDFDKFHSAEADNAYKKNLIHEIIDYRMDVKIKATILTANADRAMLEKIYNPYIVRRIWEASEGYRGVKTL